MLKLLTHKNTLTILLGLTATLFLYSILASTSITPALLFGILSAILIIVKTTPKAVYSVALVALEALFLSTAVQEIFIPLAQSYDEKASVDPYFVFGMILQILGFIIFPIIALLFYRSINGRTWLNLLIMFVLFDLGLLFSFIDLASIVLLVYSSFVGLILGFAIVLIKHFVIKKREDLVFLKSECDEKALKILNNLNIQPLKEKDSLIFDYKNKYFVLYGLKGKLKISSNGVFKDDVSMTDLVNSTFRNSSKVNVIINDSIESDKVYEIKTKHTLKPDASPKKVFVMNTSALTEFMDKAS